MDSFSIGVSRARRLLLTAVIGVALVGAASLTAMAEPHPGPHGGGPDSMFGGPRGDMGKHIDHMLDSVNATDAQRSQIKQIMQTAATDLKAQHETGKSLREQQMKLFTQPTVDANAIESLRQQMLVQHALVSQRMTLAMVDASRVLTPDQRVLLGQRMQARHDLMQRQRSEWQQLNPK